MPRSERNWIKGAVLALGMAAIAAVPALAQTKGEDALGGLKLSGDKPIQIESDALEVRQEENIAIFTGNVSVVQGPTLLKAGKMIVHYAKDSGSAATGSAQIERIEVEGKVYVKTDTQVATSDRGSFDMKTEKLVMTGDRVVLSEGQNVVVGCKLTFEMKTGEAHLDGCGKGSSGAGRVKMLIQPKSLPKQPSQ